MLVDDEAVLYRLRALSFYAQEKGNPHKPWRKASRDRWERNHIVSFHFTRAEYRIAFEETANGLLPGLWEKVGDSDENPLPPKDT